MAASSYKTIYHKDGSSETMVTPFFPVPVKDQKVNFLQGYVFNYMQGAGSPTVIEVAACGERDAAGAYYVNMNTGKQGEIKSAALKDSDDGDINVKVVEFGGDGEIKSLFLRENIHYFTILPFPSGSGSGCSGCTGCCTGTGTGTGIFSGEELLLYFIKTGALKSAIFYIKEDSIESIE